MAIARPHGPRVREGGGRSSRWEGQMTAFPQGETAADILADKTGREFACWRVVATFELRSTSANMKAAVR